MTLHSTARERKTGEDPDDATNAIPLIAPDWIARVRDTIERLEQRAATGERFAQLALPGWYAEQQRITQGRIY